MIRQQVVTLWLIIAILLTGDVSGYCQTPENTSSENASSDTEIIIANVRKTLNSLATLQCSFERLYYRDADQWTSVIRGTLILKEPSQFRYEDPTKLVVVDGVTVWLYVPANEQVNISVFMHEDEEFPTPKSLFRRYTEGRKASYTGEETIDGRTMDILMLSAVSANESDVKVWIDRELGCPVMTFEEYPNKDTVQYILRDLELNIPLEDSLFVFEVPPGVEIIDMRE